VVFEIAAETAPDPELLHRLKVLSEGGFRFAIEHIGDQPQAHPMIPFCSFVKVDLRKANRVRMKDEAEALQKLNVALLAEKIQTFEEYQFCQQMGFDYFQGNFICKPSVVSSPKLPLNPEMVSRLLTKLNEPGISAVDVEAFLTEDSAFSYRLLRYIDSELVSFPLKRESIQHAVERIGIDNLRQIVGLVMMTDIEVPTPSTEGRLPRKRTVVRNADIKPE
jgi:EAL and modified HD-GYP domain-containing signal transduction protein